MTGRDPPVPLSIAAGCGKIISIRQPVGNARYERSSPCTRGQSALTLEAKPQHSELVSHAVLVRGLEQPGSQVTVNLDTGVHRMVIELGRC